MFFWKNGLSKVLFLKNKYRIRFIHAILLLKKVLNICFQTFYFFSIPPTPALTRQGAGVSGFAKVHV